MTKTVRCAIYTRKSTEDGLEQDFNSLDAQREASLAYIKSQHHEGWRAIKKMYDDGGISGATLNRPAIKQLIKDVETGQIDTVVVYKVDRLTRSLADFSKLIELFDKHNVSFVSVTQQFNTTSSMGRLTLNVLLSFAQFEREITSERIRDKIAASKKKGMWMGGLPPIGYDIQEKKLVINETEAKTVRQIYSLYLELENVRLVKEECDRFSIRTKVRYYGDKKKGGTRLSRGHLYSLLKNPLYVGKVKYKNELYDGQHDAIIDLALWEDVQNILNSHAIDRKRDYNQTQINLLRGMIYDEDKNLLKTNYTIKGGKKYRYYIAEVKGGWRIPAITLECAVDKIIRDWLNNEQKLYKLFVPLLENRSDLYQSIINAAQTFAEEIRQMDLCKKEKTFKNLIKQIYINKKNITLSLSSQEMFERLQISDHKNQFDETEVISITSPHTMKQRGIEKKIILPGENKTNKDPKLMALVARSHRWFQNLKDGQVKNIVEIAAKENIDDGDVSRFIQFAFLSPEIVTSIFEGKQPADLTSEKLKRLGSLPHSWSEQKSRLGYQNSST